MPVVLSAVLHLPHHFRLSTSAGENNHRQTLAISLAQSTTGLGHLIITELTHEGCATEPALTDGLLHLALNTTILLLKTHCPPRLSVGGSVPTAVLNGIDVLTIPWARWGFHVSPASSRILARVRELNAAQAPHLCDVPASLELQALQWERL